MRWIGKSRKRINAVKGTGVTKVQTGDIVIITVDMSTPDNDVKIITEGMGRLGLRGMVIRSLWGSAATTPHTPLHRARAACCEACQTRNLPNSPAASKA